MRNRVANRSRSRVKAGVILPFLLDTFTDTNGVLLQNHSEGGNGWTQRSGSMAIQNNRVYNSSQSIYNNNAVPSGADYEVTADLVYLSAVSNNSVGFAARYNPTNVDMYLLRWAQANQSWGLFKAIGGVFTGIGTDSPDAGFAVANTTRRMTLRIQGNVITAFKDGVQIIQATNNEVTAAGLVAFRFNNAQSSATGVHCTEISAKVL
ncbi:hypothetical protein [Rhizobium phage RHph_X2_28B]|uniref:hypothetical protein n=1 Tax=Rhizobium phage RHph_X2_28B TaxID=2836086 RepID=UPI002329639F|nr:hypothetical protein PP751_gp078 [Rhizobium phage RHph_X2_28B]QWY83530.1 hypothetical protein [Rhizobium phage RHph_X2_28B]QWY83766.1 hypothetical protein [Rhizobium phage RHph_X3_15]